MLFASVALANEDTTTVAFTSTLAEPTSKLTWFSGTSSFAASFSVKAVLLKSATSPSSVNTTTRTGLYSPPGVIGGNGGAGGGVEGGGEGGGGGFGSISSRSSSTGDFPVKSGDRL